MTREEWLTRILRLVAGGFMDRGVREAASDYLAGKEPPEQWAPRPRPTR